MMQYLYRKKDTANRKTDRKKIGFRKLSATFIAALACLCWVFALTQLISSMASPIKSIPAFLPLQTGMAEGPQAYIPEKTAADAQKDTDAVIPAFRPSGQLPSSMQQEVGFTATQATERKDLIQGHSRAQLKTAQLSTDTVFSSPEEVLSYLQSYDKDIQLVSSHQENNYLDLYFYSPLLQKTSGSNTPFNMQVAVTKNHTYFGTPFINYDF